MARVHRGFLPYVQEEKWFAYYEDGTLNLHRSWTGYCIHRVATFAPESGGWRAYSAEVTRHPDQYSCTDDEEDRRNVLELMENLLIRGPDKPTIDGFAEALEVAAQPNYLGSPQGVSDPDQRVLQRLHQSASPPGQLLRIAGGKSTSLERDRHR